MAHLQLRDHLHDQRADVLAPPGVGQQRPVLLVYRVPVQAVQVGGIEEFLLHPPGFVEDLRPFLGRVNEHLHARQVQRLGLHLVGDLGGGQGAVRPGDDHVRTVAADGEVVDAGQHGGLLALLEIEAPDRIFLGLVLAGRFHLGARLVIADVEQLAVLADAELAVVALGDRQGHDAPLQSLHVDPGGDGLLLGFVLVLLVFLALVGLVGLFVLGRFVPGGRLERRITVGSQHHGVKTGAERFFLAGHIQAHLQRPGIGGSREVQVFAVGAEGRLGRVGHAVTDPHLLPRGELQQHQVAVVVGLLLGVGQPGAVRRDRHVDDVAALAGRDQFFLAVLQLKRVQAEMVVEVEQPRRVPGAPGQQGVEMRPQGVGFPDLALLVGNDDFLGFAHALARLPDPGELQAVRRPQRRVFVAAAAVAQVAHRAVLDGHGEHFAAGGQHGALAGLGDLGAVDGPGGILPLREALWQVGGNLDGEFVGLPRSRIQPLQAAAGLVDDHGAVGARRADVPVVFVGDPVDGLAGRVVMEHLEALVVTVREEIQIPADPHRVEVGGPGARDGVDRVTGGVHHLDGGGGAAAVAAPSGGAAKQAIVAGAEGDVGEIALGVEGAPVDTRFHLLDGRPALGRDEIELPGAAMVGLAVGGEGHLLAVGRPVQHPIPGRVPGQPPGLAASHADHVHVLVAIVLGVEGDHGAVR